MKKLRILLTDDQSLFREALRTLLTLQPDFDIVAEAENGERALALAKVHKPDVILMDLRMPVMGGVEATRRVMAAVPATKVVVLTTFEEDEEIFEALRAGALGYLLKACSADKLNESVRAAAKGASVLEPAVTARMMAELNRLSAREGKKVSQSLADPLSERELGVLKLLAAGCSNKEIGAKLNITEGTVKNHMTNVLGKLGVQDRTQAALRAREMGLI
ncbi:MAG: response regulator transcription factor [Lacunisphaera sp.]|jgi:DNA-binding NarL/FixJ family response regulator|nr:response regulator transcription factor [Lacunisphaera sp.]